MKGLLTTRFNKAVVTFLMHYIVLVSIFLYTTLYYCIFPAVAIEGSDITI